MLIISKTGRLTNRVAANALPETFVDHAEEIWAMLAEGKTQQQVAEEMGKTQGRISQMAKLENLCPNAWGIINGFANSLILDGDRPLIKDINALISEKLLQEILSLTESHQLRIIQELINGNIKNGQVKKLATTYAERESLASSMFLTIDESEKGVRNVYPPELNNPEFR